MKILGLDVSTKTGFAVLEEGNLVDYGLLRAPKQVPNIVPDYAVVMQAMAMQELISGVIAKHHPDIICIEQTNNGRNRTSQKQLEFIHCMILFLTPETYRDRIRYVDTSQWRSKLSVKLSKEQRKHNKAVKAKEVRGKITSKHLAVWWANETYGLKLLIKDNDIADACALATFGDKFKGQMIHSDRSEQIEAILKSVES